MTNQQWSPAALAHELFTAAQLAPGEGIENAVGRLAALVEAQQPAPSAAADLIAALEEARSAINSMKVEAETAGQGDEQMMLEACETISNEGLQADMAIRAALASAPQPSTTPQADSQPAEVWDYPPLPDFDTVEQHIYGACRRYITQDMLEPIHNLIRDAIDADRAAQHGYDAARLEIESLQARVQELEAAQRLRELAGISQDDVADPLHPRYIEGYKAGHAAGRKRAAPATVETQSWNRYCAAGICLETDGVHDACCQRNATPQQTNPAPVAQGDAEDAARYRWLRKYVGAERIGNTTSVYIYIKQPQTNLSLLNETDSAIDAARKQGANHD